MPLAAALGRLTLPLLRRLEPETAHGLGLKLAARAPGRAVTVPPALRTDLAGIPLAHPLGLAAGFDKDGVALGGLLKLGFGFVEAGTVTRRPQAGNPRPRLFRLEGEQAVVNRMGFNNKGVEALAERLAAPGLEGRVVGANIGPNKDSDDPLGDYAWCLRRVYPRAAYVAVNVSSPNTPGLRALQAPGALGPLLDTLVAARAEMIAAGAPKRPLLLKIAPDLDEGAARAAVEAALDSGIEGLIVGNTTLSRPAGLRSYHAAEAGGLSGPPLAPLAERLLRTVARAAGGRLALVACGGIADPADAYARILAGAGAVQVYTAFAYEGPALLPRLLDGLADLLARDGFASLAEARSAAA